MRSSSIKTRSRQVREEGAQSASNPWRSRGYLPHFDQPDLIQSVTFRLADSLPRAFLDRCERELAALAPKERQTKKERRIAEMLDRGVGECWLRDPEIAMLVENALLYFDLERYRLLRWCIMPNHVHVMIEIQSEYPLEEVLHSWKSFTSKEANQILRRRGIFWQREYHDRFIRNESHYRKASRYIEGNPVKAGLVELPEQWRWSSAWKAR